MDQVKLAEVETLFLLSFLYSFNYAYVMKTKKLRILYKCAPGADKSMKRNLSSLFEFQHLLSLRAFFLWQTLKIINYPIR